MFKKFKKIIDVIMDKDSSELIEDYSKFSFQWIKGDNMSEVRHYKDIVEDNGKQYLLFTDGGRIALDLFDEYMIRIEKGFEDNIPKINSTISQVSVQEPLARSGVKTREIIQEKPRIQVEDKPIFSLLSKQKENWVDVDLKLSINLPPKSLWNVLLSSFDDAESEILEYVTKDLDIEVVRQSLRDSIKEIYKKEKNPNPTKNVRSQDSLPE
jgi:hypothetical protein